MASFGNERDEYIPGSDSSNDEDERRNRWAGPPSTWRQLNGAEINTLTALDEIRNQDLSVHLYNAFALKNRRHGGAIQQRLVKPVPDQDINAATGQLVQHDKWVPPRSWAAWPLPANAVPHPQFMGRKDVTDEYNTSAFKMQPPPTPKSELEEAISSAILKVAKEKFRAREAAYRNENTVVVSSRRSEDESSSSDTSEGPAPVSARKPGRKPLPVKDEILSESESMVSGIEDSTTQPPSEVMPLKSVVTADDELSHKLLRPSVQGILDKMDATLTVLHNAQESRFNCGSDSEPDSESSDATSRPRARGRKSHGITSQRTKARRRTRSGSRVPSRPIIPSEEPAGTGKKRVGRPRKVYPRLDGETDRDFAIRIARIKKKPIPVFSNDVDDAEPLSDSTPAPDSASDDEGSQTPRSKNHKAARRRSRHQSTDGSSDSDSDSDSDSNSDGDHTSASESKSKKRTKRAPRKWRTRLRDWRDILGAAALAGFPAPVVDRAARRCADLFGQQFSLHTLQEGQHEHELADRLLRYYPGMRPSNANHPEAESEDEENEEEERPAQNQSSAENRARGRSWAIHNPTVPVRNAHRSRRAEARRGHFCTVSDCPRALIPFRRRANMTRHLRLLHGYVGEEPPVREHSEDEMHGAVHVDGFLQPIKVRRVWRDEDVAKGKRRAWPGALTKMEAEVEDQGMEDAESSTVGDESS
ncbi:RNA polymerase I-specific transcription initiation factor-domain-containing protein [Xylaria sp. CBS 124048]|nr:RNA polymerase I-specific transcription initiation factor-domain-containing protein [Xylaria sp. CBS 124048]